MYFDTPLRKIWFPNKFYLPPRTHWKAVENNWWWGERSSKVVLTFRYKEKWKVCKIITIYQDSNVISIQKKCVCRYKFRYEHFPITMVDLPPIIPHTHKVLFMRMLRTGLQGIYAIIRIFIAATTGNWTSAVVSYERSQQAMTPTQGRI